MLEGKIQPIDKDIAILIAQDLSPEARSRAFAEFAREGLADAQETNKEALGRVPPHVTVVDGVPNRSEDSVKPDGTIVYEFELAQQMLEWIGEQLVEHSPVKTGKYAQSHRLFMDGVEVNTDSVSAFDGQEYVFLSVVPYARKIEGNGSRPPESSQAPDGVYEVVAALAQRRFGNIAKISFGWRAPIGAMGTALEEWASTTSQTRAGRKVAVDHWNRRQPAIIVQMR